MRKSGTIALDSRGGKPLSVWLNGKQLNPDTEGSLQADACYLNDIGGTNSSLNGLVYVKPTRIAGSDLRLGLAFQPGPSDRSA